MKALAALLCAGTILCAAPVLAEDEAPAAEWAESRAPMPFDIIRSLQFLQDQVARGNDRAIRVQALLLRRFGPVFLNSAAEDWTDPRNRRAAVLFVLSGGPPDVLAGLLREGVLPEAQRPLFEGALAYVRNDLEQARSLLSALDLTAEEPGLAGHIHLVLGQILQESDKVEAVRHLDMARLLAPGGLIEEAALRLEVVLVDELGDHGRADRLARQYFDRYARSSYSANFEARFAAIYAARAAKDAEATLAEIGAILAGLPDERQVPLFLDIGRRALVDGRLAVARLASERALAFPAIGEADRLRGRLYELASSVSALPADRLAAELAGLDAGRLGVEDAQILDVARRAASAIDTPLDVALSSRRTETSDNQPALPIFERAERILGETALNSTSAVR